MTLIDVKYTRAEKLNKEQKDELNITVDKGLIAIESYDNKPYIKGILINRFSDYLHGLE